MSRTSIALSLTLACAGLIWSQAHNPAPMNYQGRVGKVITVQETSRPAERCSVLECWQLADGNVAMHTRSTQTGQFVTVVEQTKSTADDRFLVYHWTNDGLPPNGCPVPPGFRSMSVTKNFPPGGVTKSLEIVNAPAAPPAAPPASPVVQATGPVAKPSESGVVQADMKSSAPATTTGNNAKPITNAMPRVLTQGQPELIKAMPAPAGQAPAGTVAPAEAPKGRLITVTEKGKCPEQCVVLESTCLPDGSEGMKVQSLCTGEIMTITCGCAPGKHPGKSFFDRFRKAKHCGNGCEVSCEPCPHPCPPGMVMSGPSGPAEKVTVMPKEKYAVGQTTPDFRKSWTSKPAANPLLPPDTTKPETVVGKPGELSKPAAKPVSKPGEQLGSKPTERPANKPAERPKELPKIAEKPREEPKSPGVNAKDTAAQPRPPGPPAETKFVDARPIDPLEKGINVPVPLVPLTTLDARPNVPPPQPVVRPFETLESRSVTKVEADPKAPIPVPGTQGPKTPPIVQAINKAGSETSGYQPRVPNCDPCANPVAATGWTAGPYKPVTEVPPAIGGVKRASLQQDPQTAENTVYLMTVLQTSGTPAQREWAASRLCTGDPRVAPYVVETLMTVAKSDPAPLVRVACIQSLVKLQAKNAQVVNMLQQAKMDRDPRVADEAEIALTVLTDAKPAIQQAGQKAKK